MESACKVNSVVFDKTGTLTNGKPIVTDIIELGIRNHELGKKRILQIAASIEKQSEHPLAEAIVTKAKEENVMLEEVQKFKAIPGHGVNSLINKTNYYLGNLRLIEKETPNTSIIHNSLFMIQSLESQGKTVMILASENEILGLIAVADTVKETSREAVEALKKRKIDVWMITGDNERTARAIAAQVGITNVLAEVLPENKAAEVKKLQASGKKVAMVGDGINDAPALAQADIGIAMGQTGTDVSREAANMTLMDDSFATIVVAVAEGRTIYENMKKFIFYIFSSNIAELIIVFVPLFFGMIPPLTALLILAVNVGTDMFPALALGVEPQEKDIMDRPPRRPQARIMNHSFTRRFVFIGVAAGLLVTLAYFWALYFEGWSFGAKLAEGTEIYRNTSTFAFATLVMIEMANALNSRSDHASVFRMNFFSNPWLILAIFTSVLLTFAFTTVPFLKHALETASLAPKEWLMIIAISLIIIAVEETRKFFIRKNRKKIYGTA